jgi:hypothetical protein
MAPMAAPHSYPITFSTASAGGEGVLSSAPERSFVCDACGETFTGVPGGAGLFIWTRGDEVRYEEPPLCDRCAVAVSTTAMLGWAIEDEEED